MQSAGTGVSGGAETVRHAVAGRCLAGNAHGRGPKTQTGSAGVPSGGKRARAGIETVQGGGTVRDRYPVAKRPHSGRRGTLIGVPSTARPATLGSPVIELPPLPYAQDALAPHISERTMAFHYGKHHAGYVANLNKLLADGAGSDGTGETTLEALITGSGQGAVYNNAAQIWNHNFYWRSMSPDGGGDPSGELAAAIASSFGSVDALRAELTAAATGNFGSGWTWLVRRAAGDAEGAGNGGAGAGGGELAVVNTDDADNPLPSGDTPLLTIDVWEHAYYLDYQNARPAYIATFLEHLVNWDFAAANYAG